MRLAKGMLCVAVAWVAFTAAPAGVLLTPYDSPDWNVSDWINGDPGPLPNQRGRIVVIHFFQLWCPGSNDISIPLMNEWSEKWADRDDVMVVSIHTVFEGHDVQTPDRLRAFIREKQIRHPVGIDKYSGPDSDTPITMNRFNTGGTPHVVIVDKEGQVRFSHFGRFESATIEAFIERLAKERGSGIQPGPRTVDPRGGRNRPPTTSPAGSGAARPTARQAPGGRPSQAAEPPAALTPGADSRLSGPYQLQFQQTAKSCGTSARPENLPVDITVSENRIVARFKTRFLGLNQLEANYDPATGLFSTETMRRSNEENMGFTLDLRLDGSLDLKADPPTLQFKFELDKEGDEPGWECQVSGNGSATRSARR